MKQVKFTANGCCTWLGNFAAGDVARVSDEAAAHLVNEARCAVYVGGVIEAAPTPPESAPVVAPEPKHKRKGR